MARVHQFAELLDVEPYGGGARDRLAGLRPADRGQQVQTAFHLQLQAFDSRAGDKLALLDAYSLMNAFEVMFADLEARAEQLHAAEAAQSAAGERLR